MKKRVIVLTVVLALVMSCIMVSRPVSTYADDPELTIINESSDMELPDGSSFENVRFEGNVHIGQNSTVSFSGTVEITGNLYVRGTLENYANLIVSNDINCLHFGSMFSAGAYGYGYFNNHGKVKTNGLNVVSSWLGSEPAATLLGSGTEDDPQKEEPTQPAEEPSQPEEEPTQPVEEPSQPAEEPTQPAEEPTQPTEQPGIDGGLFSDVTDATVVKASYNAIYWAVDEGIVKGYADGTFKPETICTREQFSIMLWRFAGSPSSNAKLSNRFSDIGDFSNNTSKVAVAWAIEEGIVAGFSDGSFKPHDDITRAQVAVMLWRFAGKPSVSGSSKFSDIGSFSAGVQNAILFAEGAGIASGYSDGTFKPDDGCQRQHMAIFLYRYDKNILH